MNYQLKFIDYGSDEYYQAAQLRYRLFYQEHNIPFESIFEPTEKQDLHLAITTNSKNIVVAYGRLGQNSFDEFQIYQMVVTPEYQGHGLGMLILQALIEVAVEQGASLLTLNARTTKVQFYQKAAFETSGEVFPSHTTGVPHIKMQKKLISRGNLIV
jgi:predicted GNAT family N-acyltransferase